MEWDCHAVICMLSLIQLILVIDIQVWKFIRYLPISNLCLRQIPDAEH